ncbi:MAG: acylphosphatase [Planctomycetota bacterium]
MSKVAVGWTPLDRQGTERRQVTYTGQVQGVGFRYTTRSIAKRYAVTGFVRNLPDGRVELIAEGTADQLNRFLAELTEQMSGHIRSVDCDRRPALGEFADFDLRY